MKKLYKIRDDVRPSAAALTSDGVYQLRGGFARLAGKGDDVRFFESKAYCYALMITPETPCSTAEVFAALDRGGYPCGAAQSADEAWIDLQSGDFMRLAANLHNDLYLPAAACNPQVAEAYEALRSMSPSGVVMSGSGSAVFALFESKELVWWAASRLKRKYDCRVVKIFGNPHM